MNTSKKGLTKAMRSGDSIIRAESREPRAESREPRAESREPRAESHGAAMSAPRASRGASSQSDSQPSAAPAGARRSTATRGAGWKRRLITAIAAISTLAGLPEVAKADTLVTNLGESSLGTTTELRLSVNDIVMPFTTGPHATGYRLEAVSLEYTTGRVRKYDLVYVSVYGDHPTEFYRPSDTNQVAHLTTHLLEQEGPVAGVNKYRVRNRRFGGTPVTSVRLEPNTQYWVEIFAGEDATTAQLAATVSGNESGAMGWTIGSYVLTKPEGTSDANYSLVGIDTLKLKVEGRTNPEVLISISDATATEGVDETMDFVVSLNRSWSRTITVTYITLFTGSATPVVDYENKTGTLTFRPGETSKIISIPIIDDTVDDSGETFTVLLYDAKGADVDDDLGAGIGTILNTEVLTGSFENVPAEHDGSTPFSFDAIFNSDIGISYATLRDHSFTVTNGKVTRARRNNGRNDSWEITVTPWGNDAVTVTLPGNRDCGTTAAICTKEDHPVQLSNSPSATVAGPPGVSTVPVTASFGNMPAEHNGSTFTFDLSFSENVAAGYARIRDHAFSVNGANIKKAQRKTQGSNQNWTVTVDPTGNGGVSITLPETTNCNNAGAICTDDGRKLNHSTSDSVQGPVGISVSDARVEEAAGAVLAFAVTLSRSASSPITIDYATSDGSATAGADYTETSGTLTFTAGESSQTIEVTVLDDSHDEGEETLTLTLSNASSGVLTDATATGTIENTDLLPRALMARFGRTAALHVVEQVQERIEAPRETGIEARFAGRPVGREMVRDLAAGFLGQLGASTGAHGDRAGAQGPIAGSPVAGTGLIGAPTGTADGLLGGANPMGSMPGTDDRLNQRGHFGMGLGGGNLLTGSAFEHEPRDAPGRHPVVLEPGGAVAVCRPGG